MTDRAHEIDRNNDTSLNSGRAALANEALDATVYSLASGNGNVRANLVGSSATEAGITVPDNCSEVLKNTAKPTSLDALTHASNEQLECLYHEAKPGAIPHGSTDGKAIVMPGSVVGKAISDIGNAVWGGKVFDEHSGLLNRILGHHIIAAEVNRGKSWLDGKPSTIIDYKHTSLAAGWIRDEIREVNPGLYLGVAYARYPGGHAPALFFGLDNTKHK
jgi:hypothetical protein